MRLTIELNSFKDVGEAAFASVWLDTAMLRWSRESHELLDLPKWGIVVPATGETRLCDQSETAPHLIASLEKLDLDELAKSPHTHDFNEPPGPHDRSRGRALLHGCNETKTSVGKWRILFIDRETTTAEHSNFADDAG